MSACPTPPASFASIEHHRRIKDEVIDRIAGKPGPLSTEADRLVDTLSSYRTSIAGECTCGLLLVIAIDEIILARALARTAEVVARMPARSRIIDVEARP